MNWKILRIFGERRVLLKLFYERFTEPLHLNLIALFVLLFGSFRAKVAFDLVHRQHYAYLVLKAADTAAELGLDTVTILELGVASGMGMLNLAELAGHVTRETGVRINIVGFDSGEGMPPPRDYRDHPELYSSGDFPMEDPEVLLQGLAPSARVVIGDVTDTVPAFLETLSPDEPIAAAVIDLDYYWSTRDALAVFAGPPNLYLPRVLCYVDDIGFENHNSWAGEMLALNEFNEQHPLRKFELYRFLRAQRVFKNASWLDKVFGLHVLDHPVRQSLTPSAQKRVLRNFYS